MHRPCVFGGYVARAVDDINGCKAHSATKRPNKREITIDNKCPIRKEN